MSVESISVREFASSQKMIMKSIDKLADTVEKIQKEHHESNKIWKEEVTNNRIFTTKHIQQYNHDKSLLERDLEQIRKGISDNRKSIIAGAEAVSMYKLVKWVATIFCVGLITIYSKDIYTSLTERKSDPQRPVEIGKDKGDK